MPLIGLDLGVPAAAPGGVQVPLELLEGVVDLAARSGYTKQAPRKQLLREGLSVMNGSWPLER